MSLLHKFLVVDVCFWWNICWKQFPFSLWRKLPQCSNNSAAAWCLSWAALAHVRCGHVDFLDFKFLRFLCARPPFRGRTFSNTFCSHENGFVIVHRECKGCGRLRLHFFFHGGARTVPLRQLDLPVVSRPAMEEMLAASLPSRSLRSNRGISLSVPRVKASTGTRAFHPCAPSLWKNLPLSVRSAISVATFKKHLKTHLFDLAFSP